MSDKRIKVDLSAFGAYDLCESSAIKLRDSIDQQLKAVQLKDPDTMTEEECIAELDKKCVPFKFSYCVLRFGDGVSWRVMKRDSETDRISGHTKFIPMATILFALRVAVVVMRDKKSWGDV